ncbi:hypothetical protein niasHT_010276 [Heterodera trifolii]|uniref:G-protein coupled receptors family 1 profile domain-containing protein n=1 Tax=Heterodera trifolii TaxID=157864 RepID=A0ABD2M5F2_9BILA
MTANESFALDMAKVELVPISPVILRVSFIMSLAILGNVLLVFVIRRGNAVARQRLSPVQLLLLHTCTADLLFALLSLGTQIAILATYPYFHGPDLLCRFVRYLQALPMYASPFLLVAISIDRYQDSLSNLSLFAKDPNETPIREECHTIYSIYTSVALDPWLCVYVLWFSIISWLLPSVLSAFFYVRVCSTVWKSRFWGRSDDEILPNGDGPGTTATAATVPIDGHKLSVPSSCQLTRDYVEGLRKSSAGFRNQMSEFDRKRIQTVRLTLTIVACNFFLWLPFCAINVIQAFWGLNLLSQEVILCVVILGNLNACVNPWIYILWNPRQTRRALFSLIRKDNELITTSTSATRQTSIGLRMSGNNANSAGGGPIR